MDFDLPEDLRMLKKTVADFVDRELIPIEQKTMDGPLMRADMREQIERKARDLGLWLLEVPVEYGGHGRSPVYEAILNDELGRAGFPLVGDPLYGGPPAFADAPGQQNCQNIIHSADLVTDLLSTR